MLIDQKAVQVSVPSRMIATVFGLSAFCVALVSGVGAGRRAIETLAIALASLFVFHVVGLIVGTIVHRVIRESVTVSGKSRAGGEGSEEILEVGEVPEEASADNPDVLGQVSGTAEAADAAEPDPAEIPERAAA